MKLYLLRHGQTESNIKRTYCGFTDVPVSEFGRELLEKKRKAGGYMDISSLKVYTSGMLRTEQTLEILFGDVPHTAMPRFKEMNFGVFEDLSYEELKDREDYQAWISGDHNANIAPGGESGYQMQERAINATEELLAKGEDALVVCHGGVIAALFLHYFPGYSLNWYEIQPFNGEGYLFEFDGSKPIKWTRIPQTD